MGKRMSPAMSGLGFSIFRALQPNAERARPPATIKATAYDRPVTNHSWMTPPTMEPSKQPEIKFSKKRLALAFAIAGSSDAIGAFATPLPPIVWVVDLGTALLLFMVLGRQWLLLPGLALEAIPGLGVLPFWLLVVGAIAVLGTPRPKFEQH